MNKNELSAAIAAKAGLSRKDAEAALCAMSDIVAESLRTARRFRSSALVLLKLKSVRLVRHATPRPVRKSRSARAVLRCSSRARRSRKLLKAKKEIPGRLLPGFFFGIGKKSIL